MEVEDAVNAVHGNIKKACRSGLIGPSYKPSLPHPPELPHWTVPVGPWSKRPVSAIVRRNFLAAAAGGGGGRIRDDRETIERGGGGDAEADGGAGETEDEQGRRGRD
ncbi:hypothetical protein RHGRI_002123 [Rhododendron griersonianum]|uniref:Uncharacterized protein n=1 Tax=Rhododendron griersonianum TaxID=479676 RepID=A0AAV6LNR0_9ERIC|nr:hypothetical protein RHGRI_002123 [Rhododendron griersonianum]